MHKNRAPPGPQEYVKQQPVGLFLEALGYYFTHCWGVGRAQSKNWAILLKSSAESSKASHPRYTLESQAAHNNGQHTQKVAQNCKQLVFQDHSKL